MDSMALASGSTPATTVSAVPLPWPGSESKKYSPATMFSAWTCIIATNVKIRTHAGRLFIINS